MIVRTITCHNVYNHGASLQTYALQRFLCNMGHDAAIIDYRPDYLRGHFNLWFVSDKYNRIPLCWLYLLAKFPQRLLSKRRQRAFDKFTQRYLRLTPVTYYSYNELLANPPQADAYIAGSDQIWNLEFPNGHDKAFFLAFVPSAKKRISYAPSFAHARIPAIFHDFVKRHLANFDALSVREETGVRILDELGYKGCQVCDPVFLLDKKEWDEVALADFSKERYILVYDFEQSATVKEIVVRLSRLFGCEIYSVSPYSLRYADKNFINIGPDTFVSLIRDAQCVVSNSFHGSAFSLLFEKDFFIVRRNDGLNDRMEDFLSHYGLSDRLTDSGATDETLLSNIDYLRVNKILKQDISFSKKYLSDNLGCCGSDSCSCETAVSETAVSQRRK